MRQSHGSMLTTLEKSRDLLRGNAPALGDAVPEVALAKLDDAIAGLADTAARQDGHTRSAKGSLNLQRVTRQTLIRDHMAPIAKIAALELAHVPQIIALTLPRTHASVQQLATLAKGMGEAADPYTPVFVAAGRKPDFLARMHGAASEMLAASAERAQSRLIVTQTGTDLRTRLARGRKVIHLLDALVKSATTDNPGLLDAWKLAKRVPKKGSVSRSATPGETDGSAVPAAPATHLTVAA